LTIDLNAFTAWIDSGPFCVQQSAVRPAMERDLLEPTGWSRGLALIVLTITIDATAVVVMAS
jgi:hypothetical protein